MRRIRSHAHVLIGVLGGLPFAVAYLIWFPWAPSWKPHVRMTVGRCAPWIAAIHPDDCAYLDRHPAIVLSGPGRVVGGSSRVRRVPADAKRKVDVALSPGWYDLGIQLPGDRVVPVRGGQSELIVFFSDERKGTLTPDSYWRLDPVER
ncbi:MAG TPA: hypothetical protein VGF46_07670 [Gaiellales bacterium]|jgi:hypothetical protein